MRMNYSIFNLLFYLFKVGTTEPLISMFTCCNTEPGVYRTRCIDAPGVLIHLVCWCTWCVEPLISPSRAVSSRPWSDHLWSDCRAFIITRSRHTASACKTERQHTISGVSTQDETSAFKTWRAPLKTAQKSSDFEVCHSSINEINIPDLTEQTVGSVIRTMLNKDFCSWVSYNINTLV